MYLNDLRWRKSSRSGTNGSCVEAASPTPHTIAVRDSKNAAGHDYPVLTISPQDWTGFLTGLSSDRF